MPRSEREWHGMTDTPEYTIWCRMKARCLDPNDDRFGYYGARGITVDPSWVSSFIQFYLDMGPRPNDHSIDRIDNSQGYSAANCRWAQAEVQMNNTRKNRPVVRDGRTQTIAQWARELGIRPSTIQARLSKGDSDDYALRPVTSRNGK